MLMFIIVSIALSLEVDMPYKAIHLHLEMPQDSRI